MPMERSEVRKHLEIIYTWVTAEADGAIRLDWMDLKRIAQWTLDAAEALKPVRPERRDPNLPWYKCPCGNGDIYGGPTDPQRFCPDCGREMLWDG